MKMPTLILLILCIGNVIAQDPLFFDPSMDMDIRENRVLGTMDPFIDEGIDKPKPDAKGTCGGIIKQASGVIASPNYPVGEYPPDTNCTWVLEAEEGKVMKLKITYMDMEVDPPECPFDGLLVLDYGEIQKPENTEELIQNGILSNLKVPPTVLGEQKFCGYETFKPMTSISNTVFVYFYSDFDGSGGGFVLEWETIDTPEDEYNCNFENGLCPGWVNIDTVEDTIDWNVGTGETGTPQRDHTVNTENGKYMYAGSPNQQANDTAVLTTPDILFGEQEKNMCLDFWYYMKGEEVGNLAVGLGVQEDRQVVWMQQGNQGVQWNHVAIQLDRLNDPFRIMFVAIIGARVDGDIAIDDVTLHRRSCDDIAQPTTTTRAPTTSFPTTTPIGTTEYDPWEYTTGVTTNEMTTDFEYTTDIATTETSVFETTADDYFTTDYATTTDIVTTEAMYEYTTESFATTIGDETTSLADETTSAETTTPTETTTIQQTTSTIPSTTTSTIPPTIPPTTPPSFTTGFDEMLYTTDSSETTPDMWELATTEALYTQTMHVTEVPTEPRLVGSDITTTTEALIKQPETTRAPVANVHTTARDVLVATTTQKSIHDAQGVTKSGYDITTSSACVSKFSVLISTACTVLTYLVLTL